MSVIDTPRIKPAETQAHEEVPCAIAVAGLCKNYPVKGSGDTISALCGIDFRVPRGQHIAVLGSSGSGKSTLLGCLSGRLIPSQGKVELDQRRVATIHQDLRLVRHRTALQNVLHGSLGRLSLMQSFIRFPQAEQQKAIRLLKRVGLGERINWPVGRLSGGEQQRVAIARALMQDPHIILADEPVAALDAENARQIMSLLTQLSREHNLTLVSVLHDCALAESYADRIIGMDAGRVVFDGPATDGRSYQQCGACQTIRAQMNAREPSRAPREIPKWARASQWLVIAAVVAVLYGLAIAGLNLSPHHLQGPARLVEFINRLVPTSWAQITDIAWRELSFSLLQTLGMALLGTTLAIAFSWPLAALGARNVGLRFLQKAMRFVLNTVRTVPSLIWALIFVAVVGPGPLAGVLALTAYSVGYLTKFFYEEFEAVDPGPPSALKEIGAGGLQRFLHAVWPASRPGVLSSCLFMFEYNVRAASVLGLVSAGGIGFYLNQYFDTREFTSVFACLILLLAVVVVLDAISTRVRARLVAG